MVWDDNNRVDGNIELFSETCNTHTYVRENPTYTVIVPNATRVYHSSSKKWEPWFRWCSTMRVKKKFANIECECVWKNWNSLKHYQRWRRRRNKHTLTHTTKYLQSKPTRDWRQIWLFYAIVPAFNGFALRFQSTKLNGNTKKRQSRRSRRRKGQKRS